MTFSLLPRTTFHKFSDWMLLAHNNTHECLVSSNFHTGLVKVFKLHQPIIKIIGFTLMKN